MKPRSEREPSQIILTGQGATGRAVRYITLDQGEVEQVADDAFTLAGADPTVPKIRSIEAREGAKRMVVAVSKLTGWGKNGLLRGDDPKDPKHSLTSSEEWQPVDIKMLDDGGKFCFEELFTPKEMALLCGVYQVLHGCSRADVDEVLEGAKKVSLG